MMTGSRHGVAIKAFDKIYAFIGSGYDAVIIITQLKGGLMKKTILAVLMVLVIATPCFAEEVEPDGLFSIEGTRWRGCGYLRL